MKLSSEEIMALDTKALNAAFAEAIGKALYEEGGRLFVDQSKELPPGGACGQMVYAVEWMPHVDWFQAGPHLLDLGIGSRHYPAGPVTKERWVGWFTHEDGTFYEMDGHTQLIAALRVLLLAVQDV